MFRKYMSAVTLIVTLLAIFTQLVGCGMLKKTSKDSPANTTIKVTGEENDIFTNDFFVNLVEIEDTFRRLDIKDSEKLQTICQTLSELSLTEYNTTETDTINVKTGHSFYQFHFSDGSSKLICILDNQILLDEGVFIASDSINNYIQEQFK